MEIPSTASKTYNYVYVGDPSSLNYLAETRAATSDIVVNLVDGLMENDPYGNHIPSLAEDWVFSQSRFDPIPTNCVKMLNWYTAGWEEYAPVTAKIL